MNSLMMTLRSRNMLLHVYLIEYSRVLTEIYLKKKLNEYFEIALREI